MLILSRHRDESIVITDPHDGTRLVLLVTDVRGDKVRIGIAAPIEYAVHRGEIQDAIDRERAAVPPPAPDVAAAAERIVATLWDDDEHEPHTPDSLWFLGRSKELGRTAAGCRQAALEFVARVLAGFPRQHPAPARRGLPLTWLPGDVL